MRRLLDAFETTVSPNYRAFGLVDTSVDTHTPNADFSRWLVSAPGMVYLQVPSQVIRASLRLESWSTALAGACSVVRPGGDGRGASHAVALDWGTALGQAGRESCSRTHAGSGLVCGRPATTTVGTVSLPSLAARTVAAPAGSRQMLTQCSWRAWRPKRRRKRRQYVQPGRQ